MASALDVFKLAVKQHHEFRLTVHAFQEQLLRDLKASSYKAESYFASLVASLERKTRELIERISFPLGDILSSVSDFDEVVPLTPRCFLTLRCTSM